MFFFTDEKFQNNTSYIEYEKYCRDNWEQFPQALKSIQFGQVSEELLRDIDKIKLHDAKIISFNQDKDTVTIKLNTDYFGELKVIELNYIGVTNLYKPNRNVLGEDIENPDSDLMCHEVFIGKKSFQHSMLFSNEEQLKISFKEIELYYETNL
jgi:hypothetical protein